MTQLKWVPIDFIKLRLRFNRIVSLTELSHSRFKGTYAGKQNSIDGLTFNHWNEIQVDAYLCTTSDLARDDKFEGRIFRGSLRLYIAVNIWISRHIVLSHQQ